MCIVFGQWGRWKHYYWQYAVASLDSYEMLTNLVDATKSPCVIINMSLTLTSPMSS
jgi:hypothetical protein